MELPGDPPRLEYAPPELKQVIPTHPVVGILGVIVYGALFVLFLVPLGLIVLAIVHRRVPLRVVQIEGTIIVCLCALTFWRATAALRGFLRTRRMR